MMRTNTPGVEQGIVRAGIEPRGAAPEPLDVQVAELEIGAVQVRDLEFAARGRAPSDFANAEARAS